MAQSGRGKGLALPVEEDAYPTGRGKRLEHRRGPTEGRCLEVVRRTHGFGARGVGMAIDGAIPTRVLFRGHVTGVDILHAIGAVARKAGDDQIERRPRGPEVVAELQDLHGIGAQVIVHRRGVGDRVLRVQQQDVEVGCGGGGAADGPEGLRPLEHEETAPPPPTGARGCLGRKSAAGACCERAAFQPSNSRAIARNAPSTRTSGFAPGGFDPRFVHRGICSRVVVSACAGTSLAPVPIPRIDRTHRATLNVTRDFLLVI